MSTENVELVRRLQPRPGVNLAAVFRDPDSAARTLSWLDSLLEPDCEVIIDLGGVDQVRKLSGPAGLREAWLEWMQPWASYRTEIERMIDLGERVVVLVRDYGRYEPQGPEVQLTGVAIWTVRDRKVVRAVFYTDREAGLHEAGLRE